MEQHPENTPANQLPAGVDEGKLLEAVRASGYPLQSLVAQQLSADFEIVEEWGYTDRTSNEHRTLDVFAFRALGDGSGPIRPRLALLVECKRSDLPFVFFRPGVERVPWDFPTVVGLGRLSISLKAGTHMEASPAEFFCSQEAPFVSSTRVAVTFARMERKGPNVELSGHVPFNKIVMPLVSALEQSRQLFHAVAGSPTIVLPLCVVDAPMVIASGTPEAPSLQLEPLVRVMHQETVPDGNQWRRRNYGIDFVHRQFLGRYVSELAMPFASVLAARMMQYHQKYPKADMRPKDSSWDAFISRPPEPR